MAIRYSGDVEVSLTWTGRVYQVRIRAPGVRGKGALSPKELGLSHKALRDGSSSESYDEVARRILAHAERKFGELPVNRSASGKIVVARVFVSPCPQR